MLGFGIFCLLSSVGVLGNLTVCAQACGLMSAAARPRSLRPPGLTWLEWAAMCGIFFSVVDIVWIEMFFLLLLRPKKSGSADDDDGGGGGSALINWFVFAAGQGFVVSSLNFSWSILTLQLTAILRGEEHNAPLERRSDERSALLAVSSGGASSSGARQFFAATPPAFAAPTISQTPVYLAGVTYAAMPLSEYSRDASGRAAFYAAPPLAASAPLQDDPTN